MTAMSHCPIFVEVKKTERTMDKMKEGVIGILGGMGPGATLYCFAKIIENTPATKDQDHLRILIDCNPKVPDRTAAILQEGASPLPMLVQSALTLEQAGANFIIIPCVSAHFFFRKLRRATGLPILSIFDVVAEAIEQSHPQIRTVGVLGTTGTVQAGLLQRRLAMSAINTVVCDEGHQSRVMARIYDIKKGELNRRCNEITADLVEAAKSLVAGGAQGIVAACTEIPLALGPEHLSVPYFDSLLLLARAAIRQAGRDPVER